MTIVGDLLSRAMWGWIDFKSFIEHASAISNDAVHVLVGCFGTLMFALLTRRSVADWSPWLLVLAGASVNEAGDLLREQWSDAAMQYGESAKDLVLTLAVPTALLLAARLCPRILSPAAQR